MKFGPVTINRAQNAVTREKPDLTERGAPGTSIFGGQLNQQTDYNPDLMPPLCYDVYDKMRLSDGQVGAALKAIKLPIMRAHWTVESASDKPLDREIAEFCERGLRNMSTAFEPTLQQILLFLDYGSMPFEPVWYINDDGMIGIRKLAPRLPRSIIQWLTDEYGGFSGIKQGVVKASGYTQVDIPASKLVLFINEQEGANFRGISVLRRAYKHWYYKQGLERIDAIANEKRGIGVDIGIIKAGATDKADIKAALERSLMTLHGHEKQYIVTDEENYEYRLETGGARGGGNAVMTSIEHHNLQILRAVIAEFIGMGSGSTGSLAMHKDKTGFFLMALEATSDNVAETLSAYLLKPWVGYNWSVSEFPRMKYSRLDTRDSQALAQSINQLVTVGALTPSPNTERELRAIMDLPDLEIEPVTIAPPEPPNEPPDAVETVRERQIARLMVEGAACFRPDRPKQPKQIAVPFRGEMAVHVGQEEADRAAKVLKMAFEDEISAQIERGSFDEDALRAVLEAAEVRPVTTVKTVERDEHDRIVRVVEVTA